MSIKCIIIEDEPLAMERNRSFVLRLPHLHLEACFDNAIDAMAYLKDNPVDLILLDINLGDFSGINLLEATKVNAQVIIVTAYHEYALKGFELQVTDYLLKPYTFERFVQAADRVQNNLSKQPQKAERKFLFIKTEHRLEKVMLDQLLFIEGMRDYRRVHTTDKQIMTLQTFKEFEQDIPSSILCRCHKSYIVAIDKIDAIERNMIRIGTKLIPISETYRKDFYNSINRISER